MTYVKIEYLYVSGTEFGEAETGFLFFCRDTFLSQEKKHNLFPGILWVNPENRVKFSESGCSFKSGCYTYSY